MTLSDPNPGFKVTGYLKVDYLADGARVFNCTKHIIIIIIETFVARLLQLKNEHKRYICYIKIYKNR